MGVSWTRASPHRFQVYKKDSSRGKKGLEHYKAPLWYAQRDMLVKQDTSNMLCFTASRQFGSQKKSPSRMCHVFSGKNNIRDW